MGENEFWQLVQTLGRHTDEEAFGRLTARLAGRPEADITGFADRLALLLTGEPLPRGLPGDPEGSADAYPGHLPLPQDGDQSLEARLGLSPDRRDAGKLVKELLVGHPLFPG